jgi:hypothetical protein
MYRLDPSERREWGRMGRKGLRLQEDVGKSLLGQQEVPRQTLSEKNPALSSHGQVWP